jgi:hypothetical protein
MGMNTPSRSFPRLEDERAVLSIIDGFRTRTLPAARWTHQAHLAVGLWHVRRFGEAESRGLLRDGIRAYNEASGTPNSETRGYHETVTMYYVWATARFLETARATRLVDLVNDFVESRLGSKDGIFFFWSRDLLLSTPARLGWIEPDLRPLSVEALAAAEPVA